MTFSEKYQTANVDLAFRLMMAELGDAALVKIFFDPARDPFVGIYKTTWRELIDQGWLEELQLRGQTCYRLKGAGWIEGLWRAGEFKEEAMRERMSQLAAVLKGHVKGRQQDVVLAFDDLVRESGLPEG